MITEEGISKFIKVRIRLAGEVVVPTKDCAKVWAKANARKERYHHLRP